MNVRICSHRGRFGGNIVENTLPAFEAALRCGADIVETDIRRTKDGQMILFHDPSPLRLLGLPGRTEDYTLSELRERPLLNVIGEPSGSFVNTLEELLSALRGRAMINLDQCGAFAAQVYDLVDAFGIGEQALIKSSAPYGDILRFLESRDFLPQFIPVITREEEIPLYEALPAEARITTVEVFAYSDDDRVVSPGFVSGLRRQGRGLWLNALSLKQGRTLCAGHDDTLSVTGSPDAGWGWLISRGATVIQTDWPLELRQYLSAREKAENI